MKTPGEGRSGILEAARGVADPPLARGRSGIMTLPGIVARPAHRSAAVGRVKSEPARKLLRNRLTSFASSFRRSSACRAWRPNQWLDWRGWSAQDRWARHRRGPFTGHPPLADALPDARNPFSLPGKERRAHAATLDGSRFFVRKATRPRAALPRRSDGGGPRLTRKSAVRIQYCPGRNSRDSLLEGGLAAGRFPACSGRRGVVQSAGRSFVPPCGEEPILVPLLRREHSVTSYPELINP